MTPSILVTLQHIDTAGAVNVETVLVDDCRQVRAALDIVRCLGTRGGSVGGGAPALNDDGNRLLLTVTEAAKRLRISRTAAYAMAHQFVATNGASGLPVVKFGRTLRVPVARLDEVINGYGATDAERSAAQTRPEAQSVPPLPVRQRPGHPTPSEGAMKSPPARHESQPAGAAIKTNVAMLPGFGPDD